MLDFLILVLVIRRSSGGRNKFELKPLGKKWKEEIHINLLGRINVIDL